MEPAALSYACLSAVTLALQPHQQTGPNSAPRVQARAWGWACLELGRTAASRVSRRNWRGALAICLARMSGQETPCLAVPSCSSAQRNLFFAEALRLHARPPFGAPRGRMLSVCHRVVRAAGYSLLLFLQLAAAVTAAAFCINDAIGPFGSQSFFWPYVTSTANTRTLLFEYNGVCRRASAYSSSECYPYDASPGPIVADNEYLNWYRQQLASFDGGLAMAGTVLAAMGCLIVPLTLHRAVTMVYCGGPEATRWFYNWTSRALLGVALAQLLGTLLVFAAFFRLRSVMAFEHYQSEGPDKHTPSQKSYPPWSIPGHGYSDDVPSSFLDSLKSSSERWLAPLAVFPALAGCILTALQEYVIARHKPLDMGPALPCCTPGVCMSGRAASSGLCGDVTFVECSWRRRFSVCYATTRRTRPGNTDACAVDTLRVFALPPLAAVPVASLVLSIITASRTEMPFQFSAWGEVFSGSEQVGFATITYTVTGSGVCLTTVSPTLVDAGYQSSACSGLGQGRLALTQGFQQLPQGEDFTTLSVPYIASQLPIAAAAAPAALVMNTIVVLCMTSFLVCNLRHGRAAKAFAVWGRVVAILLGLACVGSLIANVAGYDAKQSMCRGYFEAAGATAELRWCWVGELGWDSGSFDPITLPQLLRKLINPISLPYTFVPEFASVQSNIPLIFNDECLVVSAIQLVLFVPVAVVAFLATLEGSADGEGARADAALTPSDQGAGAESGPAAAGSCRTDGHDSAPSAAEDQGRRLRVADRKSVV